MEDRIELKNKINSDIIKVGSQKIEICNIIPTDIFVEISDICLQQFEKNGKDIKNIGLIKTIFDMLVAHCCTNLEIPCVESSKDKDGLKLIINTNREEIINFDNSCVAFDVLPKIRNYQYCLDLLLREIDISISYQTLLNFSNNLPNPGNLTETLKSSLSAIADYKEKDPKGFEQILTQVAIKDSTSNKGNKNKSKK